MIVECLLFQVYSPLVSWGDIAVGGERRSFRNPSKSAIIGLISAALGIRRDEEILLDRLSKGIGIAVLLYSGGTLLRDFHTIQVPKRESKVFYHTRREELLAPSEKIGTLLSAREYCCDALAVVSIYLTTPSVLIGNDQLTLPRIEEKFKHPKFQLYFGRKSAIPALPLAPKIVTAQNLKDAFDQYTVQFISPIDDDSSPDWLIKSFEQYPLLTLFDEQISYFWEDGAESGIPELQMVERYDDPLSRKRWQFRPRMEKMGVLLNKEVPDVSE